MLLDSEPLHYEAVRQILAEQGRRLPARGLLPIPRHDADQHLGRPLRALSNCDCRSQHSRPANNADVLVQYQAGAPQIRGARELAQKLTNAGVPIAVASSSHREWVEAALSAPACASSSRKRPPEMKSHSASPHPRFTSRQPRSWASTRTDCIAVEDAPAGVESAAAAGMRVVLVRSELTHDLNLTADWEVDDLTPI